MTRVISKSPVTFRALIPKKLSINGLSAPIRDSCIADALAMGKDFEKVTRTWKGDKPRIQTEAKTVPSGTPPYPMFHTGFSASAWAREDSYGSPASGYWKFRFLDQGTKVRYAVMSNPFIPKTRVSQLNSWAGKGKMLFVSRKHPRPGITARKFTKALLDKWKDKFKAHIKSAVADGVKASGHAA